MDGHDFDMIVQHVITVIVAVELLIPRLTKALLSAVSGYKRVARALSFKNANSGILWG